MYKSYQQKSTTSSAATHLLQPRFKLGLCCWVLVNVVDDWPSYAPPPLLEISNRGPLGECVAVVVDDKFRAEERPRNNEEKAREKNDSRFVN